MPSRSLAVGAAVAALTVAACGGGSHSSSSARAAFSTASRTASTSTSARGTATAPAVATSTPPPPPPPPPPAFPRILPAATDAATGASVPVATWRGQPAVWLMRSQSGVTLMTIDQHLLALHLHSGTIDAGTLGWRFGPSVGGAELRRLVGAFNGGFRLSVGAGGFMSYGRTAVALQDGRGSIVTYPDGTTDIGAWHDQVPAPGHRVLSVRQNLSLLVDHGQPASNADCASCWGATLGGVSDPARSALGITADGRLVWAAGEHLTPSQLASALVAAHVERAVELDINPEWVAGYLYGHRGGHGPLAPVPVVPGQNGIPGQYLAPWSRDFFTIVAR